MSETRFTIVTDGREQKKVAYQFEDYPVDVIRKNLEWSDGAEGDYTIEGYEDRFAVERKSLNDLAACCGSRRAHFEKQVRHLGQLDRAAVVIEAPKWKVEKGMYYSKIHPNSITGTVDKWPHKYGVDFYWNENEAFAEVKTYQLLSYWHELAQKGLL